MFTLLQNGQPQPENSPGRGCLVAAEISAGRSCKPNSVVCGHSSRRRVAADVHQRPTRRFRRPADGSPLRGEASMDLSEQPYGAGPAPDAQPAPARVSLPIWSCSVWGLPCPRRYRRSGALLPHLFTLTPARTGRPGEPVGSFRVVLNRREDERGVAEAVCFLWHWPSMSLYAHVPDVIRHTALRSSDFPPPSNHACARPPAATARSSCQFQVYSSSW